MSKRGRTKKQREIRKSHEKKRQISHKKKLETKKGHREKEKQVSNKKLLYRTIAIVFIIGCCFLFYSFLHPSNVDVAQTLPHKAAIIDQLSISHPNQTFVQMSTAILEEAGFIVDYYSGENVTVEFFRSLPSQGYGLIVLRVHSGLTYGKYPPLAIFTSEPYSKTKYINEQLTDRVVYVYYNNIEEGPYYFGIRPKFVKLSMNGRFTNTIIIMMGCDGLRYSNMAKAFVERGAAVYVGWNGLVSADHTDQATICLLQGLTNDKKHTIEEVVIETMKEVGSDPTYNSTLSIGYIPNKGRTF
jgi:hypothetical protein